MQIILNSTISPNVVRYQPSQTHENSTMLETENNKKSLVFIFKIMMKQQ